MPNSFDAWAPQFDGWRGPPRPDEVEALASLLDGAPGLLDLGGGTGRYAVPLAPRGHTLTVLDRSRGMLREARKKGLPALVAGTASRLPFRDAAFDAVLFVEMLHLVDDWAGAVREMGRVASRSVVALVKERTPDGRRLLLETRAEMGFPTGLLDEGVRALARMLPPERVLPVRATVQREDLAERIHRIADQSPGSGPPGLVEAATAKVRRLYGTPVVEMREEVRAVRWPSAALRGFVPPT